MTSSEPLIDSEAETASQYLSQYVFEQAQTKAPVDRGTGLSMHATDRREKDGRTAYRQTNSNISGGVPDKVGTASHRKGRPNRNAPSRNLVS